MGVPPAAQFARDSGEITKRMWSIAFEGRAANFWFLPAMLGSETGGVIIFLKLDIRRIQRRGMEGKLIDSECIGEMERPWRVLLFIPSSAKTIKIPYTDHG
jgi:hypothetical protein